VNVAAMDDLRIDATAVLDESRRRVEVGGQVLAAGVGAPGLLVAVRTPWGECRTSTGPLGSFGAAFAVSRDVLGAEVTVRIAGREQRVTVR
jgi:hypothetical protein